VPVQAHSGHVKSESKIIVNLTRGNVVCEQTAIAYHPLHRMRGLLGRSSLSIAEGLLLQPAPSIHTAFMRFPIDVVFLDRDLKVVKLVERLRPWRAASARRARATLELAAGQVAAREIQIGDSLAVLAVADAPATIKGGSSANGAPAGNGLLVGNGRSQRLGTAGARKPAEDDDRIRVLLVGKDRRFRSVATALLTRRGCDVTLAERTANIAELANRERTEVAVLDASSSLSGAARDAAQIQALDPPVAVVLVDEECEDGLSALPVLPKWGSFDELYGAIEAARPTTNWGSSNGRR
jgi:uncharacterized protein